MYLNGEWNDDNDNEHKQLHQHISQQYKYGTLEETVVSLTEESVHKNHFSGSPPKDLTSIREEEQLGIAETKYQTLDENTDPQNAETTQNTLANSMTSKTYQKAILKARTTNTHKNTVTEKETNQKFGSLDTISERNGTASDESDSNTSDSRVLINTNNSQQHRVRIDMSLEFHQHSRTITG